MCFLPWTQKQEVPRAATLRGQGLAGDKEGELFCVLALLLQVAARFEKLLEVETPRERWAGPSQAQPSPVPDTRQATGILSSVEAGAGRSCAQLLDTLVES